MPPDTMHSQVGVAPFYLFAHARPQESLPVDYFLLSDICQKGGVPPLCRQIHLLARTVGRDDSAFVQHTRVP